MKTLFRSPKEKAVTGFWSLSQKVNKIQRLLFYLLILFLPAQLGMHFWPDFSFIKGVRIDYLSPTLYVTDILIILIFILSVAKFPYFVLQSRISRGKQISIFIFVLCLIIGIVFSKSPMAGVYGLVKLIELVFLGTYTAKNISKLSFKNILLMFSIGIIFESLLAAGQYFNHGSLQGVFYFFGERFFNSQTPGIANASLGGELFLRPYGTFPHPNVLSGYLVVVMTIVISNFKFQISNIRRIFYYAVILIGTAALFLTLSRVAIALWILIFVSFLVRKLIINHSSLIILTLVGLLMFGLVTPLGLRFTGIRLTDESIVQRESLIQSSIVMIKDNPLIGVGLNNFLINLPSKEIIQPVHNIFLLVLAQTGIVGFSFFVWFLIRTYRFLNHKSYIIILLTSVLTLGMFDHYFLTLQQGQLLLSFVLGLCWVDPETSSG